jgi:hypothetical protein
VDDYGRLLSFKYSQSSGGSNEYQGNTLGPNGERKDMESKITEQRETVSAYGERHKSVLKTSPSRVSCERNLSC